MLRSRGNRLPSERTALSFSFYRAGRACRLALSHRLHPSVSFSLTPPPPPPPSRRPALVKHQGPPPILSSFRRPREERNRRTERVFLLPSASSPDRLYRPAWMRPFSCSAPSAAPAIAPPLPVRAHIHPRPAPRALFPAEDRAFFRARPRFLADFIPIPRNKLASDHGGICLLDDLSLSYSS